MKIYRCALIGCGGRAYGHARAYAGIPRGELVACANKSNAERRERFAETFGIVGYASPAEMLEKEQPDLVHIVTMPDQWVPLMTLISECGVPACLVEKPIACEVADWKQLRELEAKTLTKFGVNKQFRWHPDLVRCREALKSGKLGKLLSLDFSAQMNIAAQGTHIIDWAMSLNYDLWVRRVFGGVSGAGTMEGYPYPAPDATVAQVVFTNGVNGVWTTGLAAPNAVDDDAIYRHCRVAAHAEKGRVLFEEFGKWEIVSPDGSQGGHSAPETWAKNNDIAQAGLTNAMFDWLEDDTKPVETNLKVALHQWNAVLGVYASALFHQPIDIPFEPPDNLFQELKTALGLKIEDFLVER
jgi:predicted dehydrogenase